MKKSEDRKIARLKDVAQAANVSLMTASRALRGIDGVSETKRIEILRIARRLNYVPNSNARSLVAANSDLIGISLPTFANEVFGDILDGMRRTFDLAGFASVIDTSEYSIDRELAWGERLLSWKPAGVILTGIQHHPALREKLKLARVPVLEIWDYSPTPIDICVGIDHRAAGELLGRYVAGLGYVRPAFVGTEPARDLRAEKRWEGVRSAFGGGPFQTLTQLHSNAFQAGMIGAQTILAEGRPDVIFFLNDHMAFGGMMACEALGLDIPGDIGIVGFNGLGLTSAMPISLTTALTPRRQMGIVGARNLLARVKGVTPDRAVALPTTLVEGATVRRQT